MLLRDVALNERDRLLRLGEIEWVLIAWPIERLPFKGCRKGRLASNSLHDAKARSSHLLFNVAFKLSILFSMPVVADGRNFIPSNPEVAAVCKTLTFSLDEAVRLLADPDPFFVANKLIGHLKFTYLTGWKGIQFTGLLLTIPRPGSEIATRLGRAEEELKKIVEATVLRRNDIVHRADRKDLGSDDPQQHIIYSWALQAVETIRLVCTCLDELVAERLEKLRQGEPVLPARGSV
jgi:hypothetical protein